MSHILILFSFYFLSIALPMETFHQKTMLGSKDLDFYVFRTLICIVGKS